MYNIYIYIYIYIFAILWTVHPNIMSPLVTCVLNSHPKRVTIPDAVLIQLS